MLLWEFGSLIAIIIGSGLLGKKPIILACAGVLFSGQLLVSLALNFIALLGTNVNRLVIARPMIVNGVMTLILLVGFAMFFIAALIKDGKRRAFAVISAVMLAICVAREVMGVIALTAAVNDQMLHITGIDRLSQALTMGTFFLAAIGLALIPSKPDALKQ